MLSFLSWWQLTYRGWMSSPTPTAKQGNSISRQSVRCTITLSHGAQRTPIARLRRQPVSYCDHPRCVLHDDMYCCLLIELVATPGVHTCTKGLALHTDGMLMPAQLHNLATMFNNASTSEYTPWHLVPAQWMASWWCPALCCARVCCRCRCMLLQEPG